MKIDHVIVGAMLAFSAATAFAQTTPLPPTNLVIDGGEGAPSNNSGVPFPGSGSTIVWDTRKGGLQDFQVMSALSQMNNLYSGQRNSNGATTFFETNVDGKGTNARGCQFAPPNGTEQECYFATEGNLVRAPASGWYTQFKVHLGKSSTGGGTGPLNSWTLTGSNPHQKMFIWTRSTSADRLYLMITPSQINIRSDGRNFNSPVWSINPYGKTGVQTITVYIRPETGTIRAWVGDKQVADASGLNIGTSSLVDIQETVTTFPGQQQVEYMWDTVVWY